MKKSIFRINRELDWERNSIAGKIIRQCNSKYPKDENKRVDKIEYILRNYEDYIFNMQIYIIFTKVAKENIMNCKL